MLLSAFSNVYFTESGEAITSVEFFTKDDLADFLNNRKTKKEGILQKFLVPKGVLCCVVTTDAASYWGKRDA